jgi:hypothetical protein
MPKKSRKRKSRRSRSRRKSVRRKPVRRKSRRRTSRRRKKVVKMGVKTKKTPSSRRLRRTPYPPLQMRQVAEEEPSVPEPSVPMQDVDDVPELAEEPRTPYNRQLPLSAVPALRAGLQPRRMPHSPRRNPMYLVPRLIPQQARVGAPGVLTLETLGLIRVEEKGVALTPVQTNQLFGRIMNVLRGSFIPFLRQRSHGYAQVRPTAESVLADISRIVPIDNYVGVRELIEPVQRQPSDTRYAPLPLTARTITRINLERAILDYLVRWGFPRQQYALR